MVFLALAKEKSVLMGLGWLKGQLSLFKKKRKKKEHSNIIPTFQIRFKFLHAFHLMLDSVALKN